MNPEFFTIIKNLVTLKSNDKYHLELNLISWEGEMPIYDLRRWNKDRTEMTRGITLTKLEWIDLQRIMGGLQRCN